MAQPMKPIYLWIAELPEPKISEAESNMYRFPMLDRNDLCDSLKSALLKSFVWGMGFGTISYWNDVYNENYKTLF